MLQLKKAPQSVVSVNNADCGSQLESNLDGFKKGASSSLCNDNIEKVMKSQLTSIGQTYLKSLDQPNDPKVKEALQHHVKLYNHMNNLVKELKSLQAVVAMTAIQTKDVSGEA